MTYEEKVRWLRRYQDSLRREQELAEEVERLQSEATRITPLLSGMPGGPGDGQKVPRAVERINEEKKNLEKQISICLEIRREIISKIEMVSGQREHEILRRRYILGQRFEDIACALNLDCRWIRRLHYKVVVNLEIKKQIPANKGPADG